MKTLKLEDKTARQLYKTADKTFKAVLEENWGKAFFSEKIIDRIKTWEDICEYKNIDEDDVLPFKKPKNKLQRHLNAVVKINLLSEVLNEGVIMDFNNRSQAKYYPYFEKTASGWVVGSGNFYFVYLAVLGSCFYFKDSETALYAGKQFLDIYVDYLPE